MHCSTVYQIHGSGNQCRARGCHADEKYGNPLLKSHDDLLDPFISPQKYFTAQFAYVQAHFRVVISKKFR